MKKIVSVGLIWTLLFSMSVSVFGQELINILPSGISYDEVGTSIENIVLENEATTAGVAVAIFDRNRVIYENSFGYADVENQLKVDSQTVFDWGSSSKLLVWVSVMQLWEQGKINLNQDIRTYLPEGFLHNIDYEEPVTMKHLMNHTAGFQEIVSDLFLKDKKNVISLGDALKKCEPEQIYEPGTVTAYSNWGVALAGYIVESISGIPYDQYVRENIFEPLGMRHTAISVDLSDNEGVSKERDKLQSYTKEGKLLPDSFYYIQLYPAGSCVGTLDDFRKFAQALVSTDNEKSELFDKKTTLDEMLSPTAYYGDTGIPSNYHGFWGIEYSISVLGHGGNTAGCSSNLMIDKNSGVGIVVMTNQQNESIYNWDMLNLIFGSFKDSQYADYNTSVPKGFFRTARTITKGPLSIYSVSIHNMEEDELDSFWIYTEENGIEKQINPYGDMLKLKPSEYIPMIILVIFSASGIIYSLIILVVGGLIITPVSNMINKKRGRTIAPSATRKWNYLACGLQLIWGINIAMLYYQVTKYAPSEHYTWQFVVNGIIAIAIIVMIAFLIAKRKTIFYSKKEKARCITTSIFLFMALLAIQYWHMYEFWAL